MNKTKVVDQTQISSEFFDQITRISNDGFLLLDPNQIVIDANEKFCSFIGVKKIKLIGSNLTEWFGKISTETSDTWLKLVKKVRSDNDVENYKFKLLLNKTLHYFNINAALLDKTGKDKYGGIVSIWYDVSEKIQAEVLLKDSIKKFTSLVDNSGLGIAVLQGKNRVFYNSKMHEMLGYTEAEYKKLDFLSMVHPGDKPFALDHIQKRMKGIDTSPDSTQMRILTKSGEIRWIETTTIVTQWEGHPAIQILALDITDRIHSEISLRESEKKFRFLFDNATVGIIISDSTGRLYEANHTASNITGYPIDEIAKINLKDIYANKDNRKMFLDKLKQDGKVEDYEIQLKRNNNEVFWSSLSSKIILWNEKEAIITSFMDISERKQVEIAFHDQSEMIRSIVDTSKDWIWAIDLQGIHTYSNPAIENILGYPPDKLVGNSSFEIIHPEDRQIIETNFPKWIEEKTGWQDSVIRWKHKDGSYRYLESSSVPNIDNNGELAGFRGVDRDITDRHKTELALVESEEKFRELMEQSPVAIQILSPDGMTTQVNSSFLKLWDFPSEYISKIFPKFNILQDKQSRKQGIMPLIEKAFSGEAAILPPNEYNTAETMEALGFKGFKGKKIWIQARLYPVKNEEGKIVSVVNMIEDITERRNAEQEILRLKHNLEIQVTKKTKDLNETISQLKRFNNAMVDRELRMKELYDENELLKSQLGKIK